MMTLRNTLLLSFAALTFMGCASHLRSSGATFDKITQEMQIATDSRSKNAEALLQQSMLPSLQGDMDMKELEPRFDLAVNEAPAKDVFLALVSGTRYSMLPAPDLVGTITVNLKNVTVREALETIREVYGYEFRLQGTRIHIQSNTIQTRIFKVNYLLGNRDGSSEIKVTSTTIAGSSSGSNSGSNSGNSGNNQSNSSAASSRITTDVKHDFWAQLTADLKEIVGVKQDYVVRVNSTSGIVLVRALPQEIRSVENYLKAMQLVIERQVMIEAKIIQVGLKEGFEAGVNWSNLGTWNDGKKGLFAGNLGPNQQLKFNPSGNMTIPPLVEVSTTVAQAGAKGFYGLALASANFAALLDFLETQGNVQVLSSPRIATLNNQKAVLKVGVDDYFVTGVSSSTSSSAAGNVTTPTITLESFFSGIALDVTPQIDEEDNIVLHVHPSVSKVSENQKIVDLGTLGKVTMPLASSDISETDSVVRVQDGMIVAIGGLMRNEQSWNARGVPGTTGSPFGILFGGRDSGIAKQELVILIKPTIIRGESSWKEDLTETQTRLQTLDPRLQNRAP